MSDALFVHIGRHELSLYIQIFQLHF